MRSVLQTMSSNITIPIVAPTPPNDADLDQAKYQQVLFGFNYLKDAEDHERRINQSTELTDIDNDFQENNQSLLERIYLLFESILRYQHDLKHFVEDVENGFYIQHTVSVEKAWSLCGLS